MTWFARIELLYVEKKIKEKSTQSIETVATEEAGTRHTVRCREFQKPVRTLVMRYK